jgi:putative transposase
VLLRLAYLGVTNALALLRLIPMSDRAKDTEILVLHHQIAILQRQLGAQRPRFDPSHRALLAALLHRLPKDVLQGLRLLVHPDTVLRWHRNLIARRQAAACRLRRPGRPRTRDPSASWSCAWRGRIPVGATVVCTENCSSSA